jgi:hypothetical protein
LRTLDIDRIQQLFEPERLKREVIADFQLPSDLNRTVQSTQTFARLDMSEGEPMRTDQGAT